MILSQASHCDKWRKNEHNEWNHSVNMRGNRLFRIQTHLHAVHLQASFELTRQHLLLKIRSFCWRWKQRFSSSFDTELTRLAFISKTFNYISWLLLISLLRMLHDLLRHHREEDVHFRQNKIILNRVYFFRYSLSSNIYRFVSGNVGCFNPITPSRSTTLGIWKTSGNARMFC